LAAKAFENYRRGISFQNILWRYGSLQTPRFGWW